MTTLTDTLARVRVRGPALPFTTLPARVQEGLRGLLTIYRAGSGSRSRFTSVVGGTSRAVILTFVLLKKLLVVRLSRCLAN